MCGDKIEFGLIFTFLRMEKDESRKNRGPRPFALDITENRVEEFAVVKLN
jgi:hypothetical protein